MRLHQWVTYGVVGCAVVYSGFLIHQSIHPAGTVTQSVSVRATVGNLPGEVAPNFSLKTVTGQTVTLASLRGHGVWLNFWATWCPNCKVELPIVEQEHRLMGNHVAVVGVDVQESAAIVGQFAQRFHLTYPIVLDSQGGVAAAYGVTGLPTSVFIAPDGVIQAVYPGAITSTATASRYLDHIQRSGTNAAG